MKTLRIVLSVSAVVCGLAGVFSFTQQTSWFKSGVEPVEKCEITSPVNTDLQPCLVQSGTQCMCGVRNAYETEAAANSQDVTKLLKYIP
jgi:hypothetical protein